MADTTTAPAPVQTPTQAPVTTPLHGDPDLEGDHDRYAHYVRGKRGESAEALVMRARVEGIPVEALCGKLWIPDRDPSRYPVCPTCEELAAKIRAKRR